MSQELIRCFIAIKLPLNIRHQIQTYIREISPLTSGVKWVKTENLHLTLKFLGDIESGMVDKINNKLGSANQTGNPFDLRITQSGCFPGRQRPRVFWLGLDKFGLPEIIRLQRWIEDSLNEIGIDRDKRRFSPHLTIGRIKETEDYARLYSFLDKNPFDGDRFKVDEIYLIRSILKPAGAEYKDLGIYSLS